MMTDETPLAGPDAYLRPAGSSSIDLAAGVSAVSPPLGEGVQLDVDGVDLVIEAEDLATLFALQSTALVEVQLTKELFPGLFADPYTRRVHTISGFEDLQRGTHKDTDVLRVDNLPTLVSTGMGGLCAWTSAIYPLPTMDGQPAEFYAAAWDIPATRLAPRKGFEYRLVMRGWTTTSPTTAPPEWTVPLAGNATQWADAGGPRRITSGDSPLAKATGFQLLFEANVHRDDVLDEVHVGVAAGSLGRPLLRAVHLLERIDSKLAFRTLGELMSASSSTELVEIGGVLRRAVLHLPMPALLGKGEQLTINIAGGAFTQCHARLDARVRMRSWDPDRKARG
jgi:hypothetical protein